MKKTAALLAFFLLLLNGAAAATDNVEIHYLPFDLSTYHAITREGITGAAHASAEVGRTDPRLLQVMLDIEMAPDGPPLEEQFIRARIRLPNGWTAYFDKTGGVQVPERSVTLDQTTRDGVDMNLALLTGADTKGLVLEWAVQQAGDFVEKTTDWPKTDYSFRIILAMPLAMADRVIVQVIHHDDIDARPEKDGMVTLGGGKSFELHFDPVTKELGQILRYQ
ncbi:hypothetical protein AAFN88_08615 [Pelagibius sp. CAU 1746]|uniref:hypothetical protein n=1 Tax=Pelagibius sp. CAU 1746 TaxID=3140370 RepID=UPI00325AB1F3